MVLTLLFVVASQSLSASPLSPAIEIGGAQPDSDEPGTAETAGPRAASDEEQRAALALSRCERFAEVSLRRQAFCWRTVARRFPQTEAGHQACDKLDFLVDPFRPADVFLEVDPEQPEVAGEIVREAGEPPGETDFAGDAPPLPPPLVSQDEVERARAATRAWLKARVPRRHNAEERTATADVVFLGAAYATQGLFVGGALATAGSLSFPHAPIGMKVASVFAASTSSAVAMGAAGLGVASLVKMSRGGVTLAASVPVWAAGFGVASSILAIEATRARGDEGLQLALAIPAVASLGGTAAGLMLGMTTQMTGPQVNLINTLFTSSTFIGLLTIPALVDRDVKSSSLMAVVASTIAAQGLIGGVLLAPRIDVTEADILLLNAGAFVGTALGGALGLAIFVSGAPEATPIALGVTGAGTLIGLGSAATALFVAHASRAVTSSAMPDRAAVTFFGLQDVQLLPSVVLDRTGAPAFVAPISGRF